MSNQNPYTFADFLQRYEFLSEIPSQQSKKIKKRGRGKGSGRESLGGEEGGETQPALPFLYLGLRARSLLATCVDTGGFTTSLPCTSLQPTFRGFLEIIAAV